MVFGENDETRMKMVSNYMTKEQMKMCNTEESGIFVLTKEEVSRTTTSERARIALGGFPVANSFMRKGLLREN